MLGKCLGLTRKIILQHVTYRSFTLLQIFNWATIILVTKHQPVRVTENHTQHFQMAMTKGLIIDVRFLMSSVRFVT